ncbi:protein phosphatase 2C domain-containing protein [Aggregatilineales bacterium SYSU G02658]
MSFLRNLFGKSETGQPKTEEAADSTLSMNEAQVPDSETAADVDPQAAEPSPRATPHPVSANDAKTARFDSVTRDLNDEPPPDPTHGKPTFAAVSDRGIVRLNNEDAVFAFFSTMTMSDAMPNVGVFIVADGMGGHELGEKASALAVRTAVNFIMQRLYLPLLTNDDYDRPPIAEILIAAVKAANDAVLRSIPDGGTTLSIMVLLGDWGHFAHVGDSRIYIITKEQAELLTRDHSYVQRLIELNQITPEESKNHPQRNVLYRAIGQNETIEVDTISRRLTKGTSVLMCTDGLWDVVSNHQIREIVNNPALSPDQICEKLCALAITQGSMDNVSTLLVKMPS